MPKIPKSVEESKVQIFDRRETIISNTGELFCHMETISSPVMFTCATNLEILSRSSHIFADGTFSHSPKHYEQLYTIHTLQNGFYIPIVYCFFTSKSTQTYIDMWLAIVELCLKLTGINLKLSLAQSTFHFDFEKSIHNAVKEIFPNCRILACRFHLNQAWFRHIQKDSQLLNEYKSNSELGIWLKKFFALGFLPANLVENAFLYLIENAPTSNFRFSDYLLKNYIETDAQFPPTLWADKPSEEARTTNGPESFHMHYNSQFYTSHPSTFQVINILLGIQTETYLKINSIKRNEKNKLRKEQENNIKFIMDTWEKFKNNKISMNDYLQAMGPRFCASRQM
uniref:MULE transposase domain-containing protein n=1 Tax=Schizaphis graminum TaxID=13262 RepID=A0A2S2NE88_SCHGA